MLQVETFLPGSLPATAAKQHEEPSYISKALLTALVGNQMPSLLPVTVIIKLWFRNSFFFYIDAHFGLISNNTLFRFLVKQ